MNQFTEKRLVFQLQPQSQPNQEIQQPPIQPPVETGKEGVAPSTEKPTEAPVSVDTVSNEYKTTVQKKISSESDKLTVFQNLKVG